MTFSINISVSEGSLVALVGITGSGKSSVLSAILGEMHDVTGALTVEVGISDVLPNLSSSRVFS